MRGEKLSRAKGKCLRAIGVAALGLGGLVTIGLLTTLSIWLDGLPGNEVEKTITQEIVGGIVQVLAGATVVTILYLVAFFANRLIVKGGRLSKRRLRVRDIDHDKPFVLYLRSFVTDGESSIRKNPAANNSIVRIKQLEEVIAEAVSSVGPLFAIGSPSEPLPHLGAERVYLDQSEWQPVVIKLIQETQLAIIRIGTTPGVLWEVENCVKLLPPSRVLLILPTNIDSELRRETFQSFLILTQAVFSKPLPSECGDGTFIRFSETWESAFTRRSTRSLLANTQARLMREELSSVFESIGVTFSERGCLYHYCRLVFLTIVAFILAILGLVALGSIFP